MPAPRVSPFGQALRHWRTTRRLSQLELASLAGTPPRHVSFLETGRARPSGEMVRRLAEALDLPPDEHNRLLTTAGFAPIFAQRPLSHEALRGVHFVVDRLLASHEPYPALVLTAWYDVVQLNDGARALFDALGLPAGGDAPVNLVALLLTSLTGVIDNSDDVLRDVQVRLRRDLLHRPGDERLTTLLERVNEALATLGRVKTRTRNREQAATPSAHPSPVLLTRFRTPAGMLHTLSALVHFSGAQDVTVHGLHVELIYPADAATAAVLASLAGHTAAARSP